MGAKVATFDQCYNAEKRRRLLCKYVKMDVWTLDVWTKEKIQKFRIQFLQGQVNMMEIVEEYSIIIYNIYIIYNNTTISQSGVWQP